jgi:hypothetical protein
MTCILAEKPGFYTDVLELGVATVAEGSVLGVFAGTEGHLLFLLQGERQGGKLSTLVGPVAEGLVGRLAAGASVVGASLQCHDHGLSIGNDGFSHRFFLSLLVGVNQ